MATDSNRDLLNLETNARFWSQTGYKPNHKLDPANATDKSMMPVWMKIFRQVEAEDKAGKLILTYDSPPVKQALSDAEVAHRAAVVHADAAVKSTNPSDVHANAQAAATATQISAQKAKEAAAHQPPSVSHADLHEAGKEAAKNPPPAHASAQDHIAHEQTQALSREALIAFTNELFWQRTNYKRGQKLDMSNPKDVEMAKIWRQIFDEVQKQAAQGTLPQTPPQPAPQAQVQPPQPPRGVWQPTWPPRPQFGQPGMGPQMGPHMGPHMGPGMGPHMGPDMGPQSDPRQVAAQQMAQAAQQAAAQQAAAQQAAAQQAAAQQAAAQQAAAQAAAQQQGSQQQQDVASQQIQPGSVSSSTPAADASALQPTPVSTIFKWAIGFAIAGGGVYLATRHKPVKPQLRHRSRPAKVILATPARVTSPRIAPALTPARARG